MKEHPIIFSMDMVKAILAPRVPCYIWLWDHLNAKRGYGWAANPWVWVIDFGTIGVRLK